MSYLSFVLVLSYMHHHFNTYSYQLILPNLISRKTSSISLYSPDSFRHALIFFLLTISSEPALFLPIVSIFDDSTILQPAYNAC